MSRNLLGDFESDRNDIRFLWDFTAKAAIKQHLGEHLFNFALKDKKLS